MTSLRLLAVLAATCPCLTYAAPPAAPLEARVSVRVRQAPLSSFLQTLSAQAKLNFIMGEGVGDKKVTAYLHDVSIKQALDILGSVNGIGYRQLAHTNTYIVALNDSALLHPARIEGGPELDQVVTVRVKQAPLAQVLETISAQTKLNFVMDEGLDGLKVTAFLNKVTVREALEILTAMKDLDCRLVEGESARRISRRKAE